MYKIYIDTTKRHEKSVKLVRIEKETEKTVVEEKNVQDIVSTIDRILREKNIKNEEIEKIVPNTGPGSFTGIKIGITIANIFNWALGKEEKGKKTAFYTPEYGGEPNIQN